MSGKLYTLIILGGILLLLSFLRISDYDPEGHYAALDLPQGVPHRISTSDAKEAFERISGDIRHQQIQHECVVGGETDEGKETDTGDDMDICYRLAQRLGKAQAAVRVLGDVASKHRYDFPPEMEPKNYHAILNINRDAGIEETRASYLSLSQPIQQQLADLDCQQFQFVDNELDINILLPSSSSPSESPSSSSSSLRSQCLHLRRQQLELNQAVKILGDETSRAVYHRADKGLESEELSFITSPLKLATGPSPFHFLFPLLTVFAVVFYITQQIPRAQVEMRAEEGEGEEKDEAGEEAEMEGDAEEDDDEASRRNRHKGETRKRR